MSRSVKPNDESHNSPSHDPGALAAWGMIGGGVLGAVVGLFFGRPWIGMVLLGVVGWTAGALIDRAKR